MKRERALVLALALVALALRFAAAWRMPYWDDDVGTVAQADRIDSVAAALEATRDWHPPLSFLFAKAWLRLAGLAARPGEELWLRAPFLVLGALAVPLGWLVARRFSPRGALLVALGLAVHPLLVWSDRDIRGYALLVPLTLLATLFWLKANTDKKIRDWALFVLFAALACWDHYNALPFTAALLALSFLEGRRRPAILAGLGVLVLFAPWLPAMKEHLTTIDFARHQGQVQLAVRPVFLTAPAYVFFGMVLGYTVFPWNLAVVVPAALAAAWLALRGALAERRAAVLGLVLPALGAAATSFKMPRYHVASVPFLLIVIASGASRTKSGRICLAVILAAMLFSDIELLRGREHHFLFPLHPWPEAARLVRARPAPVVAPPGPFRFCYVPDLICPMEQGAAPVGSSCWLLVDEKTTAALEEGETAALRARGFRATEDVGFPIDADHEARERWVGRGTRQPPVRLVRFER